MTAAILSFTAEGKKQSLRIGDFLGKCGYEVVAEHFGKSENKLSAEMSKCGGTSGDRSEDRPARSARSPQSAQFEGEPGQIGENFVESQEKPGKTAAGDFVGRMFHCAGLLVFVGACGIAVRLIAPYVRDKKSDPAVLVADEKGQYIIPILSGHLGGANRYAGQLAEGLGATAVITTATDMEDRFAPDLFAEKYHLNIRSMEDAKAVAAAGLQRDVRIFFDVPCEGKMPPEKGAICENYVREGKNAEQLVEEGSPGTEDTFSPERKSGRRGSAQIKEEKKMSPCVLVTNAEITEVFGHPQCVLTPGNLILGIGCRRGTGAEQILSFAREILREQNLSVEAICCLASIDLKRDEPGIIAAARDFGVPFVTCSAEELNALPGEYTASEFVKRRTGTDNVCERSAAKAGEIISAGSSGRFLLRKRAKDGVTLAVFETAVILE